MFQVLWYTAGSRRGSECEAGRRGPPWGQGTRAGRRAGPPEWLGDFFGPPPRAERGGVRYLVLDAIAERPRHGYEVMQAIEERSGGSYRPSPGVIYPTLQLLEELGHARVSEQEGRKVYAITDEGSRDLEEHRQEVADFYDRSSDDPWPRLEDFGDLIQRGARLLKTFKRAARRGHMSAKTQARLREVLSDAIQRIESILNED